MGTWCLLKLSFSNRTVRKSIFETIRLVVSPLYVVPFNWSAEIEDGREIEQGAQGFYIDQNSHIFRGGAVRFKGYDTSNL